ncbi:type VII secretion integral membrane protein EccD, partial [Mycobacterium kubicae]|uniref:type VII secretion integral membrane protein EccD n=1 Tax=Mycobacterium kubicae TaxID=120959 RepID=UPI0008018DC9
NTCAAPNLPGTASAKAPATGASAAIALIVPSAERERVVAFFTAVAVLGAGLALAAGAELLWHLSLLSIGCGLIVAALLVTIQAPQLSALWARFPLPVIPAPGDPTPSAPSVRVLEDLPRRVRVSDAHQNGFIAAAVLLSVLGSVAIAWRPDVLSLLGWYVVAATAAAATLRARVWDSATCKAWLLAQPFLVAGILLVVYTATAHYVAAFGAVLVLTVLALAWMVVALNPNIAAPESYSLPLRRLLGFVAAALDASLIPVMAFLVGLFAWVLNR